jgi:predicted dehydrogenase
MSAPAAAGSPSAPLVRIGIIGCGEIAQVVHIPTLGHLSAFFRITYLCDVSKGALEHSKAKVLGAPPATTTDPAELCNSPDVDVVFVVNSDAYHAEHAILALKGNKHVFIEKPAALSLRDLQRVQDAEAASQGRAMVGYMRRFAAAFQKAKELVGGLDNIVYARVRGKHILPSVQANPPSASH